MSNTKTFSDLMKEMLIVLLSRTKIRILTQFFFFFLLAKIPNMLKTKSLITLTEKFVFKNSNTLNLYFSKKIQRLSSRVNLGNEADKLN